MTTPMILGEGGLPKLRLTHPNGSSAEIYQHGAHVASWKTADGVEQLFLSGASHFKAQTAIRGGVPIIFPQFSNFGPLPMHGLVRTMDWQLLEHQNTQATFIITETEETLKVWPFHFELHYHAALHEKSLSLTITIKNTGDKMFTFQNSLHTYFRVKDINQVSLRGLKDSLYNDRVSGHNDVQQREELFHFTQETDLIFPKAPHEVLLNEGTRNLNIKQQGFTDRVVFNPWIKKGDTMADLEKEGYLRMVCVEAASVIKPLELAAHKTWQGSQTFTLID